MRRCNLAYLGFITGFIGLIFLPIGFKIIAFFFPAIFLCLSINREKYNFNLLLFLVILFPFLFIPSQMFTFDASQPFDMQQIVSGVNSGMAMVIVLIYYGVPTFLIAGSIYAIAIGQIDSASKVVLRGMVLMGVLFLFLYGFIIIGLDPTGGALTDIGDYYISLIIAVFEFPSTIYNVLRGGITAINSIIKGLEVALETLADPTGALDVDFHFATLPNLPSLPSYNIRAGLTFDASWREFNAMDYETHTYAINDALPIIMTGLCLITGLFMTKESWEKEIVRKIDLLFGEKEPKHVEYSAKVDFGMYVYLTIILFGGWYLLLSYGGSYGTDPLQDWRMILYIFYSIIIVACVFLLTTKDLFYYERGSLKKTITGTILGVIILKIITFYFTVQVLDAYSNADLSNDFTYIGLTFVFIAPAESLFFFVFFPGLVFGMILSSTNKKRKILYESDRRLKLAVIDTQIETLLKQSSIAKMQKNTKLFNWIKASIDYLEKRRKSRELREPVIYTQKKAVFGRWRPFLLFGAFGVVLPAYLFSMIHYPMLALNTGMDYATFWNCGLGIIYFCVGVFFILLSISAGWQPSIWAHAIFNVLTIMLVIITLGV